MQCKDIPVTEIGFVNKVDETNGIIQIKIVILTFTITNDLHAYETRKQLLLFPVFCISSVWVDEQTIYLHIFFNRIYSHHF